MRNRPRPLQAILPNGLHGCDFMHRDNSFKQILLERPLQGGSNLSLKSAQTPKAGSWLTSNFSKKNACITPTP